MGRGIASNEAGQPAASAASERPCRFAEMGLDEGGALRHLSSIGSEEKDLRR